MTIDKDVVRFGAGMPQFGRILFSPTDNNNGGTDLDALLAEADPSGGSPPDPNTGGEQAPGEGDGGTGGGTQDSSGAEVDLGTGFGKVKVADLKAAWGRNKQNSQSAARNKKYERLLAELEKDPSLHDDVLEALASRDDDAPARGRKAADETGEEDEGGRPDPTLLQKNPVEYIRRLDKYYESQLFEQRERMADQMLEREERELRTEQKLDDEAIREIQKVCLKYRDSKGDPIPMKLGFDIWNSPKLRQEQAKLKDQINARSSGIPGGRSSGILSRKKVSEMSETEREQAMIDDFYAHQSKGGQQS